VDLAAWFQELRRRRVIRALLGWGLLSFAVLQIVEPVQHALGIGEWFLKVVVAILAVGFPVTAGLSWAFDLTGKGVERTAEPAVDDTRTAPRPGPGPALALVVVGALIGALVAWLALRHAGPPAPIAGADGRVTLAVADFANDTRDPDLDGLSGLLITSLEQSRKLKVLTRARMIELLRQSGKDKAERIDEVLAREVGQKAGVRTLLLASIRKLGDTYAVELRAVDPGKDHYLFTLREQAATKGELLGLIDRLSDRTRIALRESDQEVKASEVNVAEAVTPSLEAYRHYFRGLERVARLDDDAALAEFRAAVAIEPRFALAELEIAQLDSLYGRNSDQVFQRAASHAEALPVKERELVRAQVALQAGRQREAVAILEPLAIRFPDDRFVAFAAGAAAGCPEGMPHRRRALALAPDWDQARIPLIYCLLWQGKSAEAIAEAEAAEKASPTGSSAAVVAIAHYEAGDVDGAIRAARRAGERGHNNWSRGVLISALATRGDFAGALVEAKNLTGEMRWMKAVVHAEMGQLDRCLAIGDEIARSNGARAEGVDRNRRAAIAVARGRAPAPAAPAAIPVDGWWGPFMIMLIRDPDELAVAEKDAEPGTAIDRMYRALLAGARGNPAEALALLPVEERVLGDLQLYYRMVFASEAGRDAEVVATLAKLESRNLSYFANVYRAFLLARGRYLTAVSLDRLGRRDEARAVLAKQLDRWKDADRDLPLLADMKALCEKIGCRAVRP
jgi:tetratricopeptide (TPR) repeat protein